MKVIIPNITEAARLILAIIRDPETGIQMKSLYEQNVGLFETFLESVPTTLILTYMCVTSVGGRSNKSNIVMIFNNKFHIIYNISIIFRT